MANGTLKIELSNAEAARGKVFAPALLDGVHVLSLPDAVHDRTVAFMDSSELRALYDTVFIYTNYPEQQDETE